MTTPIVTGRAAELVGDNMLLKMRVVKDGMRCQGWFPAAKLKEFGIEEGQFFECFDDVDENGKYRLRFQRVTKVLTPVEQQDLLRRRRHERNC